MDQPLNNSPAPQGSGVPVPAAVNTAAAFGQPQPLPVDVVDELNKKAQKHGVRYSKLEADYRAMIVRPEIAKLGPAEQKRLCIMMIGAACSRYADNPLSDYEFFIYGINLNENWHNSKIICGSMLPGKDVPDLFNGKVMGIPTIITNFAEKYKEVEKMQPFTFWRANLTSSQPGAPRREITSTVDSEYTPVNHPEITKEQIQAWLNANYPVQTLAALKEKPSTLIQPRKAGNKPFVDVLDFKRVVVAIKNSNLGKRADGTEFCQYTVVDDTLTDEEKMNVKDATGKVTIYGGVSMSVPMNVFKALNLDVNSVVEALVTVRKTKSNEDGTNKSKTGIALDAMAITPIVDIKKKTPVAQTSAKKPVQTGLPNQAQAFDLASA